jgi:DUF971 family protein
VSARHPVEIELTQANRLEIVWDDAHRTAITINALREFCPCATCRKARMDRVDAAEIPAKRRSLNVLGVNTRYDVEILEHVGRYGLGVTWKDGHRSIFTYEYLADLCPCSECEQLRGGPPVPFDPIPMN